MSVKSSPRVASRSWCCLSESKGHRIGQWLCSWWLPIYLLGLCWKLAVAVKTRDREWDSILKWCGCPRVSPVFELTVLPPYLAKWSYCRCLIAYLLMLARSFVRISIILVHSQFKVLGCFAIKSSVYLKPKFLERKSSWNKFSSLLYLIAIRSWKFCFTLVEMSVTRPSFELLLE